MPNDDPLDHSEYKAQPSDALLSEEDCQTLSGFIHTFSISDFSVLGFLVLFILALSKLNKHC